jgi:hypothetical protein
LNLSLSQQNSIKLAINLVLEKQNKNKSLVTEKKQSTHHNPQYLACGVTVRGAIVKALYIPFVNTWKMRFYCNKIGYTSKI